MIIGEVVEQLAFYILLGKDKTPNTCCPFEF